MRSHYLVICMLASTLIIVSLLTMTGNVAALNGGLVPIPQPAPLSMEQMADFRRVAALETEMARLRKLIRQVVERVDKQHGSVNKRSLENLSEISFIRTELDLMQYQVNELRNQLPAYRPDELPSGSRRELFNK